MEFEKMKRKQLQSLCKKHNLPANASNLEMASALSALLNKEEEEEEEPVEVSKGRNGESKVSGENGVNKNRKVTFCEGFVDSGKDLDSKVSVGTKSILKPYQETYFSNARTTRARAHVGTDVGVKKTRSEVEGEVVKSTRPKRLRKGASEVVVQESSNAREVEKASEKAIAVVANWTDEIPVAKELGRKALKGRRGAMRIASTDVEEVATVVSEENDDIRAVKEPAKNVLKGRRRSMRIASTDVEEANSGGTLVAMDRTSGMAIGKEEVNRAPRRSRRNASTTESMAAEKVEKSSDEVITVVANQADEIPGVKQRAKTALKGGRGSMRIASIDVQKANSGGTLVAVDVTSEREIAKEEVNRAPRRSRRNASTTESMGAETVEKASNEVITIIANLTDKIPGVKEQARNALKGRRRLTRFASKDEEPNSGGTLVTMDVTDEMPLAKEEAKRATRRSRRNASATETMAAAAHGKSEMGNKSGEERETVLPLVEPRRLRSKKLPETVNAGGTLLVMEQGLMASKDEDLPKRVGTRVSKPKSVTPMVIEGENALLQEQALMVSKDENIPKRAGIRASKRKLVDPTVSEVENILVKKGGVKVGMDADLPNWTGARGSKRKLADPTGSEGENALGNEEGVKVTKDVDLPKQTGTRAYGRKSVPPTAIERDHAVVLEEVLKQTGTGVKRKVETATEQAVEADHTLRRNRHRKQSRKSFVEESASVLDAGKFVKADNVTVSEFKEQHSRRKTRTNSVGKNAPHANKKVTVNETKRRNGLLEEETLPSEAVQEDRPSRRSLRNFSNDELTHRGESNEERKRAKAQKGRRKVKRGKTVRKQAVKKIKDLEDAELSVPKLKVSPYKQVLTSIKEVSEDEHDECEIVVGGLRPKSHTKPLDRLMKMDVQENEKGLNVDSSVLANRESCLEIASDTEGDFDARIGSEKEHPSITRTDATGHESQGYDPNKVESGENVATTKYIELQTEDISDASVLRREEDIEPKTVEVQEEKLEEKLDAGVSFPGNGDISLDKSGELYSGEAVAEMPQKSPKGKSYTKEDLYFAKKNPPTYETPLSEDFSPYKVEGKGNAAITKDTEVRIEDCNDALEISNDVSEMKIVKDVEDKTEEATEEKLDTTVSFAQNLDISVAKSGGKCSVQAVAEVPHKSPERNSYTTEELCFPTTLYQIFETPVTKDYNSNKVVADANVAVTKDIRDFSEASEMRRKIDIEAKTVEFGEVLQEKLDAKVSSARNVDISVEKSGGEYSGEAAAELPCRTPEGKSYIDEDLCFGTSLRQTFGTPGSKDYCPNKADGEGNAATSKDMALQIENPCEASEMRREDSIKARTVAVRKGNWEEKLDANITFARNGRISVGKSDGERSVEAAAEVPQRTPGGKSSMMEDHFFAMGLCQTFKTPSSVGYSPNEVEGEGNATRNTDIVVQIEHFSDAEEDIESKSVEDTEEYWEEKLDAAIPLSRNVEISVEKSGEDYSGEAAAEEPQRYPEGKSYIVECLSFPTSLSRTFETPVSEYSRPSNVDVEGSVAISKDMTPQIEDLKEASEMRRKENIVAKIVEVSEANCEVALDTSISFARNVDISVAKSGGGCSEEVATEVPHRNREGKHYITEDPCFGTSPRRTSETQVPEECSPIKVDNMVNKEGMEADAEVCQNFTEKNIIDDLSFATTLCRSFDTPIAKDHCSIQVDIVVNKGINEVDAEVHQNSQEGNVTDDLSFATVLRRTFDTLIPKDYSPVKVDSLVTEDVAEADAKLPQTSPERNIIADLSFATILNRTFDAPIVKDYSPAKVDSKVNEDVMGALEVGIKELDGASEVTRKEDIEENIVEIREENCEHNSDEELDAKDSDGVEEMKCNADTSVEGLGGEYIGEVSPAVRQSFLQGKSAESGVYANSVEFAKENFEENFKEKVDASVSFSRNAELSVEKFGGEYVGEVDAEVCHSSPEGDIIEDLSPKIFRRMFDTPLAKDYCPVKVDSMVNEGVMEADAQMRQSSPEGNTIEDLTYATILRETFATPIAKDYSPKKVVDSLVNDDVMEADAEVRQNYRKGNMIEDLSFASILRRTFEATVANDYSPIKVDSIANEDITEAIGGEIKELGQASEVTRKEDVKETIVQIGEENYEHNSDEELDAKDFVEVEEKNGNADTVEGLAGDSSVEIASKAHQSYLQGKSSICHVNAKSVEAIEANYEETWMSVEKLGGEYAVEAACEVPQSSPEQNPIEDLSFATSLRRTFHTPIAKEYVPVKVDSLGNVEITEGLALEIKESGQASEVKRKEDREERIVDTVEEDCECQWDVVDIKDSVAVKENKCNADAPVERFDEDYPGEAASTWMSLQGKRSTNEHLQRTSPTGEVQGDDDVTTVADNYFSEDRVDVVEGQNAERSHLLESFAASKIDQEKLRDPEAACIQSRTSPEGKSSVIGDLCDFGTTLRTTFYTPVSDAADNHPTTVTGDRTATTSNVIQLQIDDLRGESSEMRRKDEKFDATVSLARNADITLEKSGGEYRREAAAEESQRTEGLSYIFEDLCFASSLCRTFETPVSKDNCSSKGGVEENACSSAQISLEGLVDQKEEKIIPETLTNSNLAEFGAECSDVHIKEIVAEEENRFLTERSAYELDDLDNENEQINATNGSSMFSDKIVDQQVGLVNNSWENVTSQQLSLKEPLTNHTICGGESVLDSVAQEMSSWDINLFSEDNLEYQGNELKLQNPNVNASASPHGDELQNDRDQVDGHQDTSEQMLRAMKVNIDEVNTLLSKMQISSVVKSRISSTPENSVEWEMKENVASTKHSATPFPSDRSVKRRRALLDLPNSTKRFWH